MKYLIRVGMIMFAALALSACGSAADAPSQTSVELSDLSGVTAHSIATADGDRTYLLYVPSIPATDPAPDSRPVVMLFHGHGGSAQEVMDRNGRTPSSQWVEIADREGLILVVPDGADGSDRRQGWNDCRSDAGTNPEADDVAFVELILDEVAQEVSLNEDAVFATGLSNGGHFSLRLAIERPDLVAGVGIVAAAMPEMSECAEPSEPVAVLLMNGTEDPILPFAGGEMAFDRGAVLGTTESIGAWVDLAEGEADGEPTQYEDIDQTDGSTVVQTNYRGQVPVSLIVVDGGGHTEPSLTERHRRVWTSIVGPQNGDIEMAEQIWAFWQTIS